VFVIRYGYLLPGTVVPEMRYHLLIEQRQQAVGLRNSAPVAA